MFGLGYQIENSSSSMGMFKEFIIVSRRGCMRNLKKQLADFILYDTVKLDQKKMT